MSRVFSLVMLGASIVAMGAAMTLGTSDVVPYFGPTAPFLTFGGSPSPALVTTLTWFAAVSAGAGTLSGLHAARRGPYARPGWLLAAVVVVVFVQEQLPPAGTVGTFFFSKNGWF